MMKKIAVVQARVGSTRLPGKVMKDIVGKPMLWHVINRLSYSSLLDEVIVATSDNKIDDRIEGFCRNYNIKYYRGSENDVLDRYYQTAKIYNADVIIRITSDCPLIDPRIVDRCIKVYLENKEVDMVSNTIKRTYPRGIDTEVILFGALEKCWRGAKEQYQREHVTPYIYEHPQSFKIKNVSNKEDLSEFRLTVDEKKDLELIKEIYKGLYKTDSIFYLEDIIKVLEENPKLKQINKKVKQKSVK